MEDLKNFFKKIKELWKNPKLKGVVQLVFWLLFFIVVALLFRSASFGNVKDNKKNANSLKKDISNNNGVVLSYEYSYNYSDNIGNSTYITGINYKNKNVFYQENDKYYYVNNRYYNALDNSIIEYPYNLIEWQYSNIKNIINSNKYSNVTKYKDGLNKYEYIINYEDYNNYYNKNYTSNIIMNVTMENKIIKEVTINYGFGSVIITYTNINGIENLEINIDK